LAFKVLLGIKKAKHNTIINGAYLQTAEPNEYGVIRKFLLPTILKACTTSKAKSKYPAKSVVPSNDGLIYKDSCPEKFNQMSKTKNKNNIIVLVRASKSTERFIIIPPSI
jgi:hypothetical protein